MQEHTAEAAIAAIASNVTKGAGLTAFIGGLTATEVAAYGGLIVALISAGVQWYYKRKSDRRDTELHAARLRELLGGDE